MDKEKLVIESCSQVLDVYGAKGGFLMNRTDQRTNELLAQVIERFQLHCRDTKSDNPIVASVAKKMCEIEMWEMWVLTQN